MNELRTARYVSFATFRRDGRKVATPIWAAPVDDALVMFSAANAGKVKRLRNSDRAELAICDVRGKLLGNSYATHAWVMEDADAIAAGHAALRSKYGWQMLLGDVFSRLTGRLHKRVYIRIALPPSDDTPAT